ncbi:hypothetical protein N7510_003374 [Penicillium lagena]|uniref:uncharacterized protein n=1 Tax=Penicillium lagena TaxID=94218 RepID=UPI00254133C1|nr:uncharacterized protein N7510_003374 [Penicillium lagena]KAJ5619390.1 hypothetical protein N7510_003374 [Penicillium lagena]
MIDWAYCFVFICGVTAFSAFEDADLVSYVTVSMLTRRTKYENNIFASNPNSEPSNGTFHTMTALLSIQDIGLLRLTLPMEVNLKAIAGNPAKLDRISLIKMEYVSSFTQRTSIYLGMILIPLKELVWAGCDFDNNNVWDFRVVDTMGNTPHLSLILQQEYGVDDAKSSAVIYDNSYMITNEIPGPLDDLDTHELYVQTPRKALALVHKREQRSLRDLGDANGTVEVQTGGFMEFNIETGDILYSWYGTEEVTLDESYLMGPDVEHPDTDYMHLNSIDKNGDDYLISARHTNTVYLISGKTGRIIWRLGGKKNDFEMDFKFSRQHHAKFISSNNTHTVISLLDNGADLVTDDEKTSSAVYIELDLVGMKAKLLNRYVRPDGGLSRRRGNMQTLPNNNVLVCWSAGGYMSEFSHDGKLLMDAKFASDRFSTYRAYKFDWWSQPAKPPTLTAAWYGVKGSEYSTVFHVSWNGATDVKYWRFFAQAGNTTRKQEIQTVPKTRFETTFISRGYLDWVSVEALDSKKRVLDSSPVVRSSPPEYWQGDEFPAPDDPKGGGLGNLTVAGVSVAFFMAGILTSGGCCALFLLFPVIRQYYRQRYSKVRQDSSSDFSDPEDEELLKPGEA